MNRLIGRLALAMALLAAPAVAQTIETPAGPMLAQKTVRWLITPPAELPQTFAQQTQVVDAWEAGAKATTSAYIAETRPVTRAAEVLTAQ